MTIRSFACFAVMSTLAAATFGTTAFAGKWLNQFGRFWGYGYSDGYHAAPPAPIGESILVGPESAGEPTPVPAPPSASGPIEPSHRMLPKPLKPMGLPSAQLTPSPSTTGEVDSHPRRPARQPGQVLSRFKDRARKAGEAEESDGLTAPQVEGPEIAIEGPDLAPAPRPAADGSIDPYPETQPAKPSPLLGPSPSGIRPRYLLPPR